MPDCVKGIIVRPADYRSIIFDTVENRKAWHILSKRYDENATIIHEKIGV